MSQKKPQYHFYCRLEAVKSSGRLSVIGLLWLDECGQAATLIRTRLYTSCVFLRTAQGRWESSKHSSQFLFCFYCSYIFNPILGIYVVKYEIHSAKSLSNVVPKILFLKIVINDNPNIQQHIIWIMIWAWIMQHCHYLLVIFSHQTHQTKFSHTFTWSL